MNLIENGIHEVADLTLIKARAASESVRLWVADNGMVTIARARKVWKRTPEPAGETLVGTYTPSAGNRRLREDLAERLKELGR